MIKKFKKGNLLIDVTISIMIIGVVLVYCYTTATTAVNKRYQVAREKEATLIAENIMNRVLATGYNHIKNEPTLTQEQIKKINEIEGQKLTPQEQNLKLLSVGARIPVDASKNGDAPFLTNKDVTGKSREYTYQVMVEPYINPSDNSMELDLLKITTRVHYPVKVSKFNNRNSDRDSNNEKELSRDKISLEEDYRVVKLTTLKSKREYGK